MYRAVNISEETYKQLQRLATQLNKPKAQVVASLVKKYGEFIQAKEEEKLEKFNKEMEAKIKALKFSKKITIDTTNIDVDFSSLADTDYMR